MGCDIHAFLEYREAKREPVYWRALSGELNLGRHYHVFGGLAGVRRDNRPHPPVRGVPADMSSDADDAYWEWIDYDKPASVATAESYIRSGWSETKGVAEKRVSTWTSFGPGQQTTTDTTVHDEAHVGKPRYVSNPDHHTPSWVTLDEFEAALEGAEEVEDYRAVLAAGRVLEQAGNIARVVFWFDN